MEIEKKFLVKQLPDLNKYEAKKVLQGYISTDPVIRIRRLGDKFYLAMKSQGHMIREEFEMEITEEQFDSLWNKVEFTPIEKTRYFIPLPEDLVAELDIYDGDLDTLVTVEVEFNSTREAKLFTPPSWFGEDITHDNRYKNNHLSNYGIPK